MIGSLSSYDIWEDPPSISLYPLVRWYNVQPTGKTDLVNRTDHLLHWMENERDSADNIPDIDMGNLKITKEDWDWFLHGSVMRASFRLRPAKACAGEDWAHLSWEEETADFVEYLIVGGASDETVGLLKVPSVSYDPGWEGARSCASDCHIRRENRRRGVTSVEGILPPGMGLYR